MDKVHKFYSEDLRLRVAVAITSETVAKMCSLQKTFPIASIALGRSLTGAVLLASQMKEGQRIGVHFSGDGPLGWVFAEANYESEARGYCSNPQADLPLKDGKLDVAGGVGKGLLTVTRSQPFQKDPHRGIVPITSGEVSPDLAYYLFQSHQVPSIISLAVYLDGDGSVIAAGGVFVELMPEAPEGLIRTLEEKSAKAPSLSKQLAASEAPIELAKSYVHDSPLIPVKHPFDVTYTCKCSRERVERTLVLTGRASLAEMILKGADVPVTCQFCGKSFTVTVEEIRALHDNFTEPSRDN